MNQLTLEWVEAGQVRTQTIHDQQPSRYPGVIRIGRDSAQCDIVLQHPTVSGLHIEIFFYPQHSCFYLRSLRESNQPLVDGQVLAQSNIALRQGMKIRLGQLDMTVTAVSLAQYGSSPGLTPTVLPNTSQPPPYSPPPTVLPQYRQESPSEHQPSYSSSAPAPAANAPIMWGFWLKWVLASIGIYAPFVALAYVTWSAAGDDAVTDTVTNVVFGAVGGAVVGAVIGFVQWLVLRQQVYRAGWWVLATAVSFAASSALDAFLGGHHVVGRGFFTGGLLLGYPQQLVLMQQERVDSNEVRLWVMVKACDSLTYYRLFRSLYKAGTAVRPEVYVADLGYFVISTAITGLVLVWLLRHPVSKA